MGRSIATYAWFSYTGSHMLTLYMSCTHNQKHIMWAFGCILNSKEWKNQRMKKKKKKSMNMYPNKTLTHCTPPSNQHISTPHRYTHTHTERERDKWAWTHDYFFLLLKTEKSKQTNPLGKQKFKKWRHIFANHLANTECFTTSYQVPSCTLCFKQDIYKTIPKQKTDFKKCKKINQTK